MKITTTKEWFLSRSHLEEGQSIEVRPAKEPPSSGSERRLVLFRELRQQLDWPHGIFRVEDEPGEHDPCWLITPGGVCYAFNAHAVNGFDQARAQWVADTLNAALGPCDCESCKEENRALLK